MYAFSCIKDDRRDQISPTLLCEGLNRTDLVIRSGSPPLLLMTGAEGQMRRISRKTPKNAGHLDCPRQL